MSTRTKARKTKFGKLYQKEFKETNNMKIQKNDKQNCQTRLKQFSKKNEL